MLLEEYCPQTCSTQGCRSLELVKRCSFPRAQLSGACLYSHCSSTSVIIHIICLFFFNPLTFSLFVSYSLLFVVCFLGLFLCSFLPPFCLFLGGGSISLDAGWESMMGVLFPGPACPAVRLQQDASVSAGLVLVPTAGP